MSGMFLVRAELRRDGPAAAIAPLLVPAEASARAGAAHRLVWSLFADGQADRTRDFLWRETAPGCFLALAARPPADPHGLFRLDHKPFAPNLQAGQRLAFNLRVNPVMAEARAGARGRRRDVVTRAIAALPHEPDQDRRRIQRLHATQAALTDWLVAQGSRHGFTPDPAAAPLRIDAEDWTRVPRDAKAPIAFLAVQMEGVLRVDDPVRFLARLRHGFGAAKAFGCGLMLIRPARRGGTDTA